MDETTVYDQDEILSTLNEQKDKLATCYIMWWVSVGMVVFEVAILIIVAIFLSCLKVAQVYRRNHGD